MVATPQDPHDWQGIAAGLTTNPIAQLQAAQANTAPQSPKSLLDAYRAMNGGALPPGMTPEQAMLIDMGMWTDAITQNPQLLTMLQQAASSRLGFNADALAAKEQVGQNYQNLTGDVEQQGTDFMANLMQSMGITDPQAIALDPTSQGYSETIANMGETADQNQATDQAWFDKLIQMNEMNTAAQMQSMAAPPVLEGGSGGGGGGGGFRRGGGGYRRGGYGGRSGGSGDGGWTDPKTTDALTQTAAVDVRRDFPGFFEVLTDMYGGDPEAMEAAELIFDAYGGFPHQIAAGLAKNEVPRTQAAIEALTAQQAQQRLYEDRLPNLTQEASSNFRENPEWETLPEGERENYLREQAISSLQKEGTGGWASREGNPTGYFDKGPVVGAKYIQSRGARPDRQGWNVFNNMAIKPPGVGSRSYFDYLNKKYGNDLQGFNEEYLQDLAQNEKREDDKVELANARANSTTENPFSYSGWGGYVEPIDKNELEDANWYQDIVNGVLQAARDNTTTRDMQVTRQSMKDSSSTKTSQTSKHPDNQLYDNNEGAPGEFMPNSIAENISGNAGFGTSRGISGLNTSQANTLAERMNAIKEIAAQQSKARATARSAKAPKAPVEASGRVFAGSTGNSFTKNKTKPTKSKSTPVPSLPAAKMKSPGFKSNKNKPVDAKKAKKIADAKKSSGRGWKAFSRFGS